MTTTGTSAFTLHKNMVITFCKTMAYIEEVALITTGKVPKLLLNILISALRFLAKCYRNYGLRVNPAKT